MTAQLWTAAAAAAATKGKAVGDWQAHGVSIDTRSLKPGDLFVALKAVRDGHDFVAQALEKGAAAALVSHIPEGVSEAAPLLLVPDVLKGLEDLGRAARDRTSARVVAVTGSVGKTSTKEMLRTVLSGQGRTHVAEASYNNHWGVPLTLARMPADTEFAVIEIGMNHPGEIAPLARMARPHAAMITTVAAAHLEAFGNINGIAEEKASIFEGLEPDGWAVLNGDIETSAILQQKAHEAGAKIILFGEGDQCDHRAADIRLHDTTTVVDGQMGETSILFKVQAPGRHFAVNGMGVLAVITALGLDHAMGAADIAKWHPPAGRGLRERVTLDFADTDQWFELIDDAFNANPSSLAASLEVLAASNTKTRQGNSTKGRRIAVLGDMLELGPDEMALHRAVADLPWIASIDQVHCVGPRMKHLYEALPDVQRGKWVETADDMAEQVHHLVRAGDLVLIKGSKGSRVSIVVDALKKLGQGPSDNFEGVN